MIPAKRHPVITGFFHHYIIRLVKRNFQAINFNSIEVDADRPVLLIANHFSWWDGFLLYYLNHIFFKKRFHTMVLEQTVKKVFFMKYLGAFSVSPNSKDVVASLNYAAELLQHPQNLVMIFPQGKLYSNFIDDVVFEKGVFRLMKQAGEQVQVVFAASFVENFEYKKPTANVYLAACKQSRFKNIDELKAAYQQHYQQAKEQQTQISI